MKLETFFEKFDQFADASDAVAKMRELVLELGVQGKLVEQNSSDVPALDTLRHSAKSVCALVIRDEETVPVGWVSVPLGCVIASNIGGGTPSKQNPAYWDGSIPWASVKDIQADKYLTGTIDTITAEGLRNSSSNLIPVDRLIVVTRMGLGKLAINKIPVAINQDLRAIEPNESIDLDFAYLLFRALKLVGKGVTVKGVTVEELHSLPISLPPLAEQKRIVAKVDELMTLCDRLEAQQRERDARHAALARASLARFADAPTPANLNFLFHKSYTIPPADLRKSILTLAVQGKLVPQDPSDEPAIIDLAEIEDERQRLVEARKLRPNRVSEIPQTRALQYELPDSWRWFRLGDVAFFQEGPGIRNWQFRTQGIKLLNVQNIANGRLVLDNTNRYISNEEFETTYQHFAVEPGDILFASSGASWGKVAWFQDPGYTVMLNTSMVRLKFYSRRCADAYLLLFLQTEFFKRQMEIQLVGIQPNFGSTHLGRVYIPLPPLAEQRRIVAKVEQLMALVDQLEAQLTDSHDIAEKLMEAVVAELTQGRART